MAGGAGKTGQTSLITGFRTFLDGTVQVTLHREVQFFKAF